MTTEQLWQEYAFLTREMIKFVAKKDFSLLDMLLEQREKLQEMISASGDKTYRGSPSGQALLKSIMEQERQNAAALQMIRNKMQQQQIVSDAYETFLNPSIGRLNNVHA